MFESGKRGKGKITEPLGIIDMYKYFRTYSQTKIKYKDYSKIIKCLNSEIVNIVVNEGKIFEMPLYMGHIQICKFERSYNKKQNLWATDFKKSKELGFRVYHDQQFIYRWCWKKNKAKFRNKTGYKFQANRQAKRAVAKALRELKVDYYK